MYIEKKSIDILVNHRLYCPSSFRRLMKTHLSDDNRWSIILIRIFLYVVPHVYSEQQEDNEQEEPFYYLISRPKKIK